MVPPRLSCHSYSYPLYLGTLLDHITQGAISLKPNCRPVQIFLLDSLWLCLHVLSPVIITYVVSLWLYLRVPLPVIISYVVSLWLCLRVLSPIVSSRVLAA